MGPLARALKCTCKGRAGSGPWAWAVGQFGCGAGCRHAPQVVMSVRFCVPGETRRCRILPAGTLRWPAWPAAGPPRHCHQIDGWRGNRRKQRRWPSRRIRSQAVRATACGLASEPPGRQIPGIGGPLCKLALHRGKCCAWAQLDIIKRNGTCWVRLGVPIKNKVENL
jgi:hypothetical protein